MHRQRYKTLALLLAPALLAAQPRAEAQVFEPTSGTFAWNDNNNWGPAPPQPFPDAAGAAATFPAPTGNLVVDLGKTIKLGSLTINKSTTATFTTTITATEPNSLFFDGGGQIATTASFANGGGASIIAAPVLLNGPLTITQGDDQALRFTGSISGTGDINVKRDTNGEEVVAFSAANSYVGTTTVTGNGGTVFTVLRLNHAGAIPGGVDVAGVGASSIILTNSAILGLGSTDFKRELGAGASQIQFSAALNSGFAAFGGTRAVNLGGASAPVAWASSGFATLTFGAPTSDGTLEFQNPLNFGNANRTIRAVDGTAAIDGRLTASITSTGGSNTFTKTGGGTLILAAANSYTGPTIVNAGALRLDHAQALPANSNVTLSGGGLLGFGVADYAGTIGTGAGQIQFGTGNAGFAAYAGTRKVTLNGGAPLVWGTGSLNIAGQFIVNDEGSDSLLEFTNAIDLGSAERSFAGRNGTAPIDSRLTGVISGAGSFVKTQPGILELAAANTYAGATKASGGVLLLTNANSIPGGINGAATGNLAFVGGVFGLGAGDFTAPLGVGAGQVQWLANENGGFAAFGGHRLVNLGGAGAQVVWGLGGFTTANLILSWADSDGLVEFVNPIDLNGAARTFAGRDGTAAVDSRVSGVVSGTGGVLKTQPGTLEFTAANLYDGGTTVQAGRLLANNAAGSAFGTGDVTVSSGATLGGGGFIGVASDTSNVLVNAGGILAPGVDAGKLTVAGNVTLSAGSIFDIDVGGVTPGVQFDQLAVDGAATLAGTLNVDLLNSFTPASGATFPILTATGGVTGTFDGVTWAGDYVWTPVYDANTVSLVAHLAGDFNEDGSVAAGDLTAWNTGFGALADADHLDGDSNNDGDVDGGDFLSWQRQFGAGSPVSALGTSVPEPDGLLAFVFAAIGNWWLHVCRTGRRSAATRRQEFHWPAQRASGMLGAPGRTYGQSVGD